MHERDARRNKGLLRFRNQLVLTENPDDFTVVDQVTGELFHMRDAVAKLPWRSNIVPPDATPAQRRCHMPPHQYVAIVGLTEEQNRAAVVLEVILDNHPAAYLAYFRLYQSPMRYLEWEGRRYFRTKLGPTWFVNRARFEDAEPPRRVDEGARPIPKSQWGAKHNWYVQGAGYGEWVWNRARRRYDWHDGEEPGQLRIDT
jgi:hypothetical protein